MQGERDLSRRDPRERFVTHATASKALPGSSRSPGSPTSRRTIRTTLPSQVVLSELSQMGTKWMTVVELPRWTSELALAAIDAGIEIAPENGYTAEPTTVAMVVDAESPDLARRRVRDLLDGCGVRARYVVALSETRDARKRAITATLQGGRRRRRRTSRLVGRRRRGPRRGRVTTARCPLVAPAPSRRRPGKQKNPP